VSSAQTDDQFRAATGFKEGSRDRPAVFFFCCNIPAPLIDWVTSLFAQLKLCAYWCRRGRQNSKFKPWHTDEFTEWQGQRGVTIGSVKVWTPTLSWTLVKSRH